MTVEVAGSMIVLKQIGPTVTIVIISTPVVIVSGRNCRKVSTLRDCEWMTQTALPRGNTKTDSAFFGGRVWVPWPIPPLRWPEFSWSLKVSVFLPFSDWIKANQSINWWLSWIPPPDWTHYISWTIELVSFKVFLLRDRGDISCNASQIYVTWDIII